MENSRTRIYGASEYELWHFDLETRYPTAIALAQSQGFALPDQESGGWDGWVRFLHRPETQYPWVPTGLLPLLKRLCKKMQFPYEVHDKRLKPMEGVPESPTGGPIIDRDYQLAAADAAIQAGLERRAP